MQTLWDSDAQVFKVRNQLTGTFVESVSAAGFLPLYAQAASPSQAQNLVDVLHDQAATFPFALPQVLPSSPGYDPNSYCRGPVWPYLNRILADGFSRYGYEEVAHKLRLDTHALIAGDGFREYFNPHSGKGLGGEQFAWTAAAWLVWAGVEPTH